MNRETRTVVFKVVGLLAALTAVILQARSNGDFKVFLEAAHLIREGASPYQRWIIVSANADAEYFYSPLFAILLIPFTYGPYYLPKVLWLLAGLFWSWRIWKIMERSLGLQRTSEGRQWLVFGVSMLIVGRFWYDNIDMIQMTIFLLWSMMESMQLIERGKTLPGTLLLAFAINVKLMPMVLLPYLLYRMHFRALGLTLFWSVVFLYLPALYVGWEFNQTLLGNWGEAINPMREEFAAEVELGPHSFSAFIPALFMETEGVLEFKRNIASLSLETVGWLVKAAQLILIGGTLYFTGILPRHVNDPVRRLREVAYLCLIIPLIFPHQQKYAFLLAWPAAFYLAAYLLQTPKQFRGSLWKGVWGVFILAALLMTFTSDLFIGRQWNYITQHYKLISWGALILIPTLAIVSERLFPRSSA